MIRRRCLRSTLLKSINKFAGARNRFLRWWEMKRSTRSSAWRSKVQESQTGNPRLFFSKSDRPLFQEPIYTSVRAKNCRFDFELKSARVSCEEVKISLQVLILSNLQFEKILDLTCCKQYNSCCGMF